MAIESSSSTFKVIVFPDRVLMKIVIFPSNSRKVNICTLSEYVLFEDTVQWLYAPTQTNIDPKIKKTLWEKFETKV